MKYGFIIDNRKCIGCHACTTACKSEHQVPVGVNRTWVKQVEKGEFPNTRRLFSVMRCNHCTEAPCVEICPVEALFKRDDGIVDFDNDRCIGCKSCMQACPYDALYIDPETNTAAKCNYCAHRIDIGLEPACVNVCPEHAIISGDMDNPGSEISTLLARQQVKVRKAEKGTVPNLFYIDADEASLNPSYTERSDNYFWSSQGLGVGHFAKEAEKMAYSNASIVDELLNQSDVPHPNGVKSIDVLMNNEKARRIYDAPDKGVLWGWEVSAYVWTKAIATGVLLIPFIGWLSGTTPFGGVSNWIAIFIGMGFLGLTGIFLIKDLDRPDRFLNVLLRPQWDSWLVRGGYGISVYGGLLTLLAVASWFGWFGIFEPLLWLTAVAAIFVAIYTAFLFAQAKGRDFWQSPVLSLHMLLHSLMAGSAVYAIMSFFMKIGDSWPDFLTNMMTVLILINLGTLILEMITPHPTVDAKRTVHSILKGHYKKKFWVGIVAIGNILPLLLILLMPISGIVSLVAGVAILFGIYITEHVWVEAPQRLPLS